jgi:hypothetical protein
LRTCASGSTTDSKGRPVASRTACRSAKRDSLTPLSYRVSRHPSPCKARHTYTACVLTGRGCLYNAYLPIRYVPRTPRVFLQGGVSGNAHSPLQRITSDMRGDEQSVWLRLGQRQHWALRLQRLNGCDIQPGASNLPCPQGVRQRCHERVPVRYLVYTQWVSVLPA